MKSMSIEERFKKDVENHSISIRMDNGVYRDIVCSNNGSWNQRFEIVTYPGYLVFCGDMGEWVFSRTKDMFKFFRRKDDGINPGYWAEKCLAGKTTEYSEEKFREVMTDYAYHYFEDESQGADLMEALQDEVFSRCDDGETRARDALDEFGFYPFGDVTRTPIRLEDTFELNFREYTHHFLWALHAIVWAINRYDSAQGKKS